MACTHMPRSATGANDRCRLSHFSATSFFFSVLAHHLPARQPPIHRCQQCGPRVAVGRAAGPVTRLHSNGRDVVLSCVPLLLDVGQQGGSVQNAWQRHNVFTGCHQPLHGPSTATRRLRHPRRPETCLYWYRLRHVQGLPRAQG